MKLVSRSLFFAALLACGLHMVGAEAGEPQSVFLSHKRVQTPLVIYGQHVGYEHFSVLADEDATIVLDVQSFMPEELWRYKTFEFNQKTQQLKVTTDGGISTFNVKSLSKKGRFVVTGPS